MHARRVLDSRFGPRGFVPLCHCVTSPEGERKRLPPFRSLARYQEIEEYTPVLFFCARESSSGQTLRASRPRTPLSLRDISRGRMETSVAVSVARTFFRDRGVFLGLFFYVRETSSGQSLRTSRPRTPLSLRYISRGRTETSVAVSVARTLSRGRGISQAFFAPSCGVICEKLSGKTWNSTDNCVVYSICPD